MAASKDYVIRFTADGSGAISNIDKIGTAADDADKKAKSLRAQLKEMQEELANLDPNTKAFQDLSKQAGALKDTISDTADAISAEAGNAFESLGNNVSNLTSRLISLDFEGVGQSARGMAGAVKNIDIKAVTKEIGGAITGFAKLAKALLTNPIFLIGAAIAYVVTHFKELKGYVDGVSDAQVELSKATQKTADAARENVNAVSEQENILRLAGKSEEEILKLKLQQIDAAIVAQKAAIESARITLESQIAAEQRNKSILKGAIDFLTKPLEFFLAAIDGAGQAFGKDFGLRAGLDKLKDIGLNLIFDPAQVAADGKAAADAQLKVLTQLENQKAGIILGQRDKEKAAGDKIAADKKAAAEKELAAAQVAAEKLRLFQIENEQMFLDMLADFDNRQAAQEFAANQKRISEEEAFYAVKQQLITDARELEVDAIVVKYEKLFEQANGNSELEKQLTDAQQKDLSAIKDKYNKDELAKKKAHAQAIAQTAQQGIQNLLTIAESFNAKNEKQAKAQFKISKGLRIADATINAFMAASNALATTPLPPPFPQIAAGISLAAGFAQVKNIAKQEYGSSSSGGGGGSPSAGGGSTPNTQAGAGVPAFNPVNTDFINNRPEQATMSYVLAGDVANATEARSKIENLSRL